MTYGTLSPKATALYNSMGFNVAEPRFIVRSEVFTHSFPATRADELQIGNVVEWNSMATDYRGKITCRAWHPDGDRNLLAVEVKMFRVFIENHWYLEWAPSAEEAISLIERDIQKIVDFHLIEGKKGQIKLKKKIAKFEKELAELNKKVAAMQMATSIT